MAHDRPLAAARVVRRLLPLLLLGCPEPSEDDALDSDTDSDLTSVQPAACPDVDAPTLDADRGCLIGDTLPSGAHAWLGVPYAAAPEGDLRWRRPQPAPVRGQPLETAAPGPPCPQTNGTVTGDLTAGEGQEDCLTLNVIRPVDGTDLPILFFIHGGGHTDGSGGQETYLDDPGLADEAIVVTHNYRLGPLGWLAHPDLSTEDPDGVSGNWGLSDTLAALDWVRAHAERLGGDPDRILVFGESAGGVSTCALWLGSRGQDRMRAALTQSAPCSSIRRELDRSAFLDASGHAQGTEWATEAGCDHADDVPACLRALPLATVLATLPGRFGVLGDGAQYGPVVDGVWVEQTGEAAITTGALPATPLILGVNADEGTLFTAGTPVPNETAFRALAAAVAAVLRVPLDDLVDVWNDTTMGSWEAAWAQLVGDALFVCPTRRWAGAADTAGADVRAYFFSRPLYGLGELGATHGVEIPYVFGTLPAVAPAVDEVLSATLGDLWTDAADGEVSLPAEPWPSVGEGWMTVDEDASVGTAADVRPDRCGVLFR